MRHFLLLLCFLSVIHSALVGQSPYDLNWGRDGALAGSAGLTIGVSTLLDSRVAPFTESELARLDSSRVIGIDRWVIRQYSPRAQEVSDRFLFSTVALPLTLAFNRPTRREFDQVGVIALEGLLLTAGLTNLTKTLVKRPRPLVYNTDVPLHIRLESRRNRYSFFSGHTSLSACGSFLTAKMFSDFHPDSNLKPAVWAGAAALPALTGYLRVRGGKHYLTDVLVGYAIGALVGVLVPELHR